jgi:D-3-phosphoglycerate dehydrogenase
MPRPLHECRVLVTATSYGASDPHLKSDLEREIGEVVYNTSGRPYSAEQLAALIPDFDGCIAGLDPFDRRVIAAADRLQVIARYGVGVDNVDLEAAHQKGICVTNTPGANSDSVAELAVGLMLCLARGIPRADQATRNGQWPRLNGLSIRGKTVGLIGLGAIGRLVAAKLSGFACNLLAYDPFASPQAAEQNGVRLVELGEVVTAADFLSLHCPVTDETRGMVDAAFLERMKPGAFLVNTARGELLDEDALFDTLQRGHLSGAALDVFSQQPPAADHPLFSLPQVIVTPHMGAHSDSATNSMGWGAFHNCLAVLSGASAPNPVA